MLKPSCEMFMVHRRLGCTKHTWSFMCWKPNSLFISGQDIKFVDKASYKFLESVLGG